MSNTKKISYKTVASKLPVHPVTAVMLEGDIFDGTTIQVKYRLSLTEMNSLISDIVNTIIDMQTGEYNPEYMVLVERMLLLKHYAGIQIGKTDLGAAYRVLFETDLYTQAMQHADNSQVDEVLNAVSARVNFLKEMIIATAGHKAVELLTQMEQLMNSVENMSSDMSGEQISHLISMFGDLTGADVPAGEVAAEPDQIMLAA